MKFYLINPKLPLSFTSNEYAARMVFRKYASPPLGLLTAAAMIPRGHQVAVCDENVSEVDWEHDCDVVGITGMHLQRPGIRKIAAHFRKRGVKVVIGGPSVMAVPEEYRDVADVLMLGEAEQIWPQAIADLEHGTAKDEYTPAETVDLKTSPIPRYDLISSRDYMNVSLQTTRGCPFKCEFCDIISLYGRKVRTKPIDQVLNEVEYVLGLGWDRLLFVDDNFIGDPRYAAELTEALIDLRGRLPKPFYFTTQATINMAHNEKLLQRFHDGGMRSVFIGIETPRVSSLRETQKFQNVRKNIIDEIERIQSHGISVYSGLMVGFDHDDVSIFQEQVDFINEAKIPLPLPGMVTALPVTPLYDRMKAEGRLIPESEALGSEALVPGSYFTNIVPKLMSMDELEQGYRSMVLALYEPANYATRVLGELENLNRAAAKVSNYRLPIILAGFVWVLLWYVCDPNRARLLEVFRRIVPTALRRYPKVADAALQRLVTYRHVSYFVSVVDRRYTSKPHTGAPAAQPDLSVRVPA